MKKFRLYHYWRSSSSWRVRWALALKGFSEADVEFTAVSLLDGESESETHRDRHPFGYVPVLELLEESNPPPRLVDSVAILEYLEERYPLPRLLPVHALDRARVRALVEAVNANTQPLQNLSTQLIVSPDEDPNHVEKRKTWARYWLRNGMAAFEKSIRTTAGEYSFGDSLTLADLCLIPQCYSAIRYGIEVSDYPLISKIYHRALKTEGYLMSQPERYNPDV